MKKNKIIATALHWLFILSFPLLFVTTTVRGEVNCARLYEYGFTKYNVSQTTALNNTQLSAIAQRLIDFFNSRVETPQMNVTNVYGEEFALFHDYELVHLGDVKRLFRLNSLVQEAVLVYIAAYILLFFPGMKRRWQDLARGIMWGCVLTLALVGGLGLASLFFFEEMFVRFHLVVFHNLYWLLDPTIDYLIMLFPQGFPQGFWTDVVYIGVGLIVGEALLFGGLAWAIPRKIKSKMQNDKAKV